MADGGASARFTNLGNFNFLASGDGEHEGSIAFSDISFPSHVSDLESFHSDIDVSINSRQSLASDRDERLSEAADDMCENLR